jgi:hypothetical protein
MIKLDTVLVLPYSAQSADIGRDKSWGFARVPKREKKTSEHLDHALMGSMDGRL